ncbi:MAG TPA: hypothetical protein VGM86_22960 [Thermoanaerobaculia bacterium]
MWTHPDAEDIVLYAEHGPDFAGGRAVAAHLRTCEQCLQEVTELRNLRDLAAEGLPAAPPRKLSSPRLEAYLRGKAQQGKGPTILGIAAGLVGTAVWGAGQGEAAPSFGQAPVRIDDDAASMEVKETTDHTSHERTTMPPTGHVTTPTPIIGTPLADTHYFPGVQSYGDTCAIRCQEFVLRQFTGTAVPEKLLIDEARAHGWYADGQGTPPGDVGNLLELHGISVNRYTHGNIYNLTAELAQGHKVIIGVDSHELWEKNSILTEIRHALGLGHADHAVVVSGIDTSDPHEVHVIVSDPGTGEAAASYPMHQFISAWKDSDFFMVATQEPPPAELHLPEMQNFDYQSGHLDHVGEIPYDHFEQLLHEHGAHPDDEAGHGHGDHGEDLATQPHVGHDLDEAHDYYHDHDLGFSVDDHHDGNDHE